MDKQTPCYTNSVLQAIKSIIGLDSFLIYGNVITRVFQGKICGPASSPGLIRLLNAHPEALFLQKEIAAMTHTRMLLHNLPEFKDHSSGSDDSCRDQLLDLFDHFAGTEGARPVNAYSARSQVMRYMERVQQENQEMKQHVENMAAEFGAMGMNTAEMDAMEF
jgi:hypothetical protein